VEEGTSRIDDATARLARTLTAPAPETEEDIAAFRPVEDRAALVATARTLLSRLHSHRERSRARLRAAGTPASHLLRALDDGDLDALSELGIDTGYAWLDDVVRALVVGSPFVEIETVGPYAAHHVTPDGGLEVRFENLPPDEKTGVLLAAFFRDVFGDRPNLRLVALLDDSHAYAMDADFTQAQRDQYVVEIGAMLRNQGALGADDVPGRDYVLLRKRDLQSNLDSLVDALRDCGRGTVEQTDDGDLVFRPTGPFIRQLALDSKSRRRELRRAGILLRKRGKPTCAALDAAGFLSPINRGIMHVVVLDRRLESEQDKTYALLRAVDAVTQEQYHNVFFDADRLAPELTAYAVCELLVDHLTGFLRLVQLYDDWEEFDPEEYVARNYGRRILPEDREIVTIVAGQLARAGLPPGGVGAVADVGAGPNLYPAMLLAPYVADEGEISLIERSARNRNHLASAIEADAAWAGFEELMVSVGGPRYRGTLRRMAGRCRVLPGSIFELPRDAFDIVTSYFVAESITTSRREFRGALRSLAASVRAGGLLVVAHMVGSLGWFAGAGSRFPAIRLAIEDIEEAYRDIALDFTVHPVGEDAAERARPGYHGMAVVVARRT
jgi:NNMT/PNMT/TEMT family